MPLPPDLITPSYLTGYLAALDLSAAQVAALPGLIAAASRAVRAHCRRVFTAQQFDEVYTVEPPDTEIALRQFPLIAVDRCATGPTPVISVWNADAATNQRATAQIAATGDEEQGLAATGLTLSRWASGQRIDATVAFTTNMTVTGLAAAVQAVGGGWQAQPQTGYALWAASDLRPPQGAWAALGAQTADFVVHVDDLDYTPDQRLGVLRLGRPDGLSGSVIPFGPPWSGEVEDGTSYGGPQGVRVVYTAGFVAVPADVQLWTAEAVKAALERAQTDSTLKSESDGVLSWTGRDELLPLPRQCVLGLAPWVNRTA